MPEDWVAAMRGLYRRLDAELASLSLACDGCGDCCHFDKVDHVLYASELERRFLAREGLLPEQPDAPVELLAAGLRCPYQTDNRCQAREGRVLGCRLHFCSWADSEAEGEVAERWHYELKRLHETLDCAWNYRPLLPLRTE